MSALSAFLASLALAWSMQTAPAGSDAAPGDGTTAADRPEPQTAGPAEDPMAVWERLANAFRTPDGAQVRIEQHIILRISPVPGPLDPNAAAFGPPPAAPARLVERRMAECIPIASIAGAQPQRGSRLLLFLRDRRLVAADLEKACSARDFYSGFYVEKLNADGRLCAQRDRVLARSGARCGISAFRQLVADG